CGRIQPWSLDRRNADAAWFGLEHWESYQVCNGLGANGLEVSDHVVELKYKVHEAGRSCSTVRHRRIRVAPKHVLFCRVLNEKRHRSLQHVTLAALFARCGPLEGLTNRLVDSPLFFPQEARKFWFELISDAYREKQHECGSLLPPEKLLDRPGSLRLSGVVRMAKPTDEVEVH